MATTIQENQYIILKKGDVSKIVKLVKRQRINFEKMQFTLDPLIDQDFETVWQLPGKKLPLVPLSHVPEPESYKLTKEDLAGTDHDNRNINDRAQKNQALTDVQVEKLKTEVDGAALVEKLRENNESFDQKTEFSKKKFLKKKIKKHVKYFVAQRPTPRLIAKCYEGRNAGAICSLTADALALTTNFLNVYPGVNIGVVEHCSGLILSSILYRGGTAYNFYSPRNTHCVQLMNYPESFVDSNLVELPLSDVGKLIARKTDYRDYARVPLDPVTETEYEFDQLEAIQTEMVELKATRALDRDEERRVKQTTNILRRQKTIKFLSSGPCLDGLAICTKHHPASIALPMLHLVKPSRPFTIFCQEIEPLKDTFTKLQDSDLTTRLEIKEIFFRHMQVLPHRTHPQMYMRSQRGYLLTGIRIES